MAGMSLKHAAEMRETIDATGRFVATRGVIVGGRGTRVAIVVKDRATGASFHVADKFEWEAELARVVPPWLGSDNPPEQATA